MKGLLGILALVLAIPAGATGVSENPWFLQISQSDRGSKFAMNYRIRWDVSDLKRSPKKLATSLIAPIKALDGGLRDILISTRLDVYGVVMRPFRDIVRIERRAAPAGAVPALASSEPAKAKSKIDLSPLLEDARRDARREAREWIVSSIFDAALPQAVSAPAWQKDAVARDLVAMTDVWRSDR
ncbi:MAG: hypothetical protein HY925_14850 [Elusimicrobia bacterium]|nr:hypothetical protein [Elusimicrobiota bacterium]